MKTVAIFVVLFAAAIAMKLEESPPVEKIPLEQSSGRCVEYGIDYKGYDIDIIYGIQHWQDCASQCKDSRSCSYWSWIVDEHRCILKTSDAGRRQVGQAISGSYTCLNEC